jgi:hypothetical protein
VTSLTTFRHCFPRARQTGLIASTSDLFQLAACNRLLLRERLSPGDCNLPENPPSRSRASRRQGSLSPSMISRNHGDVRPPGRVIQGLATPPGRGHRRERSWFSLIRARLDHCKRREYLNALSSSNDERPNDELTSANVGSRYVVYVADVSVNVKLGRGSYRQMTQANDRVFVICHHAAMCIEFLPNVSPPTFIVLT